MRKREFEAFGDNPVFEKLFVFKGYHDFVTVHYLPKKLEQGSKDGSMPSKVTVPLRSVELRPVQRYLLLEQQLAASAFQNPKGDETIYFKNDKELRRLLVPLLVDERTALAIAKTKRCSSFCLNEEGDERYQNCKLVDNARFQLHNCPHASYHLQCIVTYMITKNLCLTYCPIRDTPQCRWTENALGKRGQAHYWAPEDYQNFAKAFFRNELLCQAFLKPEYR